MHDCTLLLNERRKERKNIYLGQHNKMEDNNKTKTVALKPNPAQHFAGLMTSAGLPLDHWRLE
jgi:hypothetical protein